MRSRFAGLLEKGYHRREREGCVMWRFSIGARRMVERYRHRLNVAQIKTPTNAVEEQMLLLKINIGHFKGLSRCVLIKDTGIW